MSGVALAIGGAAVIGGVISYTNSQNATNAQTNAANNANTTQQNEFNAIQANNAPWVASGSKALGTLNSQMGTLNKPFSMADFQADPGYQFALNQGQQAIERAAAAKGGNSSGATMKAMSQYNTGMANQQYGAAFDRYNTQNTNTFNRLSSMAGLGQTANSNVSAAGMNSANNISANQIGAGNAQAAGQIGGANAINSAMGTGMNTWMNYNLINKLGPQPVATTPTMSGISGGGYGDGTSGNYNFTNQVPASYPMD